MEFDSVDAKASLGRMDNVKKHFKYQLQLTLRLQLSLMAMQRIFFNQEVYNFV